MTWLGFEGLYLISLPYKKKAKPTKFQNPWFGILKYRVILENHRYWFRHLKWQRCHYNGTEW